MRKARFEAPGPQPDMKKAQMGISAPRMRLPRGSFVPQLLERTKLLAKFLDLQLQCLDVVEQGKTADGAFDERMLPLHLPALSSCRRKSRMTSVISRRRIV